MATGWSSLRSVITRLQQPPRPPVPPNATSADLLAALEACGSDAIPPVLHVYDSKLVQLTWRLPSRELGRLFVIRWTPATLKRLVLLHYPQHEFMLERVFRGTDMEAAFARLLAVCACGGISVQPRAVAAADSAALSLGQLVANRRVVLSVDADGAPTTELLAAQREHPLVRLLLRDLYMNYDGLLKGGRKKTTMSAAESGDAIIGPTYMAKALRKYRGHYLGRRWSGDAAEQNRSLSYLSVSLVHLQSAMRVTQVVTEASGGLEVDDDSIGSTEWRHQLLLSRILPPEALHDTCQP